MHIIPLSANFPEPQENDYTTKELMEIYDKASKAVSSTESKLEYRLKVLPRTGQKRPPPMGVIYEDDE